MLKEILLAIVIIVLIIIIYRVLTRQKRTRVRIRKLLNSSNGTFDPPAREALRELNGAAELTPEQHATRANIIRFNLLEGDLGGERIHAPHNRNHPLHRHIGGVMRDYHHAIAGLGAAARAGTLITTDVEPNLIVRQAITMNDFALNNLALNNHAFTDYALNDDDELMQLLTLLNGAIFENAPVINRNVAAARAQNARDTTATRAEAVEKALASDYTPDPQNVHDSKINADLNAVLAKIEQPVNIADQIADAEKYIKGLAGADVGVGAGATKCKKSLEVLDVIKRGEYISTYKTTEDRIFALVWARCDDVRNYDSRGLMREAVFNSLVDCYDGNPPSIVCINGRCSRVINSIALIDYDPSISGAMTFLAYRNMIMEEVKDIFDEELASAEKNLPTVAASYRSVGTDANSTTDSNVDPDEESQFKELLKSRVDAMLAAYKDKFNDREISQLREECYVYLDCT